MQNGHHELEILSTSAMEEQLTVSAEKTSPVQSIIFVLLCIILVFSTVAYGAVETWAFGFLTILIGAIAVLWLVESFIKKEFRFNTNFLQIPIIGLILIGLVQLLPLKNADIPSNALSISVVSSLSLNPYSTKIAVIQLVIYLIFFAAVYTFIDTHRRMKKIAVIVIIFASTMAFFGILQWLANPQGIYGWRPTPQAIPFASFVNRHHFASFMVMTLGLTLAILVGKATKEDKRLLLIIAIILMGISVILTSSRGGLLSLLGVIVFVLIVNLSNRKNETGDTTDEKTNSKRKLTYLGGGFALVFAFFAVVLMLGGDQAVLRGVGITSQEDFTSGRTQFWSVAWEIFKNHPIIGAGLDAFATAYPQYDTWNGNFRIEQAHNDYLQILTDAGILGFICISAFIYLLFKQGLQIIKTERDAFRQSLALGGLAGCLGVLIHSFFDFPLRTPSNGFFFLLLVSLATATVIFPKHRRARHKK
jgi:O-antigen ligase